MNAPLYQPPRGCLWPSLILGGLCLLAGGLSLLAIPKMWLRSQEEWTETAGVIVESYVKTGDRIDRETRERRGRVVRRVDIKEAIYHVRLKYRYTIAGKEYAGDAAALRQPDSDEDSRQAQAILATYPAGDQLAVFHHPSRQDQSRLTIREPAQEFVFDLCFAFMFLLCGIGLITFSRWISRRTASVG